MFKLGPLLHDVDLLQIRIKMILKVTLVRDFRQGIDTPILTIEEKYRLSGGKPLKSEIVRQATGQLVLNTNVSPVITSERFQRQMLECC